MLSIRLLQNKNLLASSISLIVAFATLYYLVQEPSDWNDGKPRSPIDCLYTSCAVHTLVGFSDGGAVSPKLRALVIAQNIIAYSQLILFRF